MGSEGVSAVKPKTVFEVFRKTVEEHGQEPALKFKDVQEVMLSSFYSAAPVRDCKLQNRGNACREGHVPFELRCRGDKTPPFAVLPLARLRYMHRTFFRADAWSAFCDTC